MTPKRPTAHVVGDRAAAAVTQVIADAGFAVERVANDYGEDMLVQTSHTGQVDASRLWIQVKGTAHLNKYRRQDDTFAVSIPYGHAIKWLRSADPVVVVLWDVNSGKGYWAWPLEQVSEWDYTNSTRSSTTLYFKPDDDFTPQAVSVLAWASRINHYRLLLLNADQRDHDLNGTSSYSDPLPDNDFRMFFTTVIFDFVELLGLADIHRALPTGFAISRPEVRERYDDLRADAIRQGKDENDAPILAGHALILEHVKRVTGIDGLPEQLLLTALALLLRLFDDMPSNKEASPG